MCTAGQRVSLTITGPGPSFSYFNGSRAAAPVRDKVLLNGEIFYPSVCPAINQEGSDCRSKGSEDQPEGSEVQLEGLRASRGGTDGRMNERTNERTENLPILQDFVPYRGRCPKTSKKILMGHWGMLTK